MEEMPVRLFVKNEWFFWNGRTYAIQLFQDDEHFYLVVRDDELRPILPEIAVVKESCVEFKRFSNPNLLEELVNRAKAEIKKAL